MHKNPKGRKRGIRNRKSGFSGSSKTRIPPLVGHTLFHRTIFLELRVGQSAMMTLAITERAHSFAGAIFREKWPLFTSLPEVLALERDSRILGQWYNPVQS